MTHHGQIILIPDKILHENHSSHTSHCHILAFLEVLSQEWLGNTWAEHRDAEWARKQRTLNRAGVTGTQCYDSQFQNKAKRYSYKNLFEIKCMPILPHIKLYITHAQIIRR
jgi:hypothetical protein